VATSVARIRRDQGKRQQARDLLAPGYGWFAEGFDTLDLKEPRPCSTRWRNNSSCEEASMENVRPARVLPLG
jgi:hypothetical protein